MIFLNGNSIPVTLFPDNTSQVWKLDAENELRVGSVAIVTWRFHTEAEFMHLAQLKALLDAHHIVSNLLITYLPYGRQDKPISNDATFGLASFAKLLNSLNFKQVAIVDPHSSVALNLINNSTAAYPKKDLDIVIGQTESNMVCYPDAGAVTKYTKEYNFGIPAIHGEKVRDQATGNITSYALKGDPKSKKVLIIDDICDGGMTFRLLAADLLKAGATEVNLFVTHGIFSKGLKPLKESGITRIFSQDGEASEVQNQLTYRRL